MIPLVKSTFYKRDEWMPELLDFIATEKQLSMGKQCLAFEKEFAQSQGRKYATLVNSGSSANLALLQALKNLGWLKTGDGVAFSAVTWATNIMPIIQMGFRPVPVGVQPNTLNSMSRNLDETLASERLPIKAFLITNALGFCGDLNKIQEICNESKIILLEDNCECLGTKLPDGLTGSFGLASTYSFYVAHHISTIEGGMICTDSIALSEMLKMVRSHGWARELQPDTRKGYRDLYAISTFKENYTFYDLGYNLKPTEITGVIGRKQLKYLDEIVAKRQDNYRRIADAIRKNNNFIPTASASIDTVSAFAIPVVCQNATTREAYLENFVAGGVETRPLIAGNMARQPFWEKYIGTHRLMGADFLDQCAFYCGNSPDYTEEEIETIIGCLE